MSYKCGVGNPLHHSSFASSTNPESKPAPPLRSSLQRSSFAQKETNRVNVPIRLLYIYIVKRFHYERIYLDDNISPINMNRTIIFLFSKFCKFYKNEASRSRITSIIRLTPDVRRREKFIPSKVCAFPMKSSLSSSDKLSSFDYTQTDRT